MPKVQSNDSLCAYETPVFSDTRSGRSQVWPFNWSGLLRTSLPIYGRPELGSCAKQNPSWIAYRHFREVVPANYHTYIIHIFKYFYIGVCVYVRELWYVFWSFKHQSDYPLTETTSLPFNFFQGLLDTFFVSRWFDGPLMRHGKVFLSPLVVYRRWALIRYKWGYNSFQ